MVTSVSDYHAPILPLKKPYFTGSQGIERVNVMCNVIFRFDISDLPLLLAVAGTHTPHLAMGLPN